MAAIVAAGDLAEPNEVVEVGMQACTPGLHPCDPGLVGHEIPVGHEEVGVVAAEDHGGQLGSRLNPVDEGGELVDRVGVEKAQWPVGEGHPPVGRRDFFNPELLGSHVGSSLGAALAPVTKG
jgi:hypothetical protein